VAALTVVQKVEYLVVNYSTEEPKVLLSLRQADILKALENDKSLEVKGPCVPNGHNGADSGYEIYLVYES